MGCAQKSDEQNPKVLLHLFLLTAVVLTDWLRRNRPSTHAQHPAPKTDAEAESRRDVEGYQSSSISVSSANHCYRAINFS